MNMTQAAQFLLGMWTVIDKDVGRKNHLSSDQRIAFSVARLLAAGEETDPKNLGTMLLVARAYGLKEIE